MTTADKRSTVTDALETLGTIIDTSAGRDAIHLAVEPVIAAQKLFPSQDVGLDDEGKATSATDRPLGIVDPFLSSFVMPGEMFWLVVYPRKITSLRHVWEHPAFPEAADIKVLSVDHVAAIKAIATECLCSYTEIMDAADNWVSSEEYLNHGERFDGVWLPDTFWEHYKAVRGVTLKPDQESSFFTCSC